VCGHAWTRARRPQAASAPRGPARSCCAARVGLAAALLDVGDSEPRELGAPEAGAGEELEDRAVADPDDRAPVRLAQQPVELCV
jgi:hypothetical protein